MHRRLNTPEAADFVGLSPRTLENLRSLGGGPPFLKVRRRVYYDVRDLEAYLAKCRRDSTSATEPKAS